MEFDFVIVGAGAAGCVLADRLSADGSSTVALVEAGPRDSNPLIHVPAGVAGLIGHPQLDWRYATQPQPGANGRRINLPRGRVLGGCTSTNGMVYFRGHPADYDEWAALGCTGWSFADVLPYFTLVESNSRFNAQPWHGTNGPMRVSSYVRHNRLSDRFVQAGKSLGYPVVEDFNRDNPEGFGIRQATIRKGRRESTATAYLRPALRRPNLQVLTEALADRIEFNLGRATGVHILRGGERLLLLARREVILSAGSYASPAILQRSGLGAGGLLSGLGIHVVRDLPSVGENLQDHLVAPVQMTTASTEPYQVKARLLPRLAWNLAEYALGKRGPLASNIFEATGFLRTEADLVRPDIQLIFMPMHRAPRPIPVVSGFGVLVGLLRPKSRGHVHVASSAPEQAPIIDPHFLDDEADLLPLEAGVRIARRLLGSAPFSSLDATEILPGPGSTTHEELRAHIRQTCVTVHHPVGTCRMGADPDSVVDPTLRLRGIDGLRVVDASVMPRLIGGNTAAPVIMIAERAADLILGRPTLAPASLPDQTRRPVASAPN